MAAKKWLSKKSWAKKQSTIRKRENNSFAKMTVEELDKQIKLTESAIATSPMSVEKARAIIAGLQESRKQAIFRAQEALKTLEPQLLPAENLYRDAQDRVGIIEGFFKGHSDESLRLSVIVSKIRNDICDAKNIIHRSPDPRPKEVRDVLLLDSTLRLLGRLKQVKIRRIEKAEKIEHELVNLKAVAAAAHGRTRKFADAIRSQIEKSSACPYCGSTIDLDHCHLDHIYPVSKGGQSRPANLVYVCADCNLKKQDMTLNKFIEVYRRDKGFIVVNLCKLGKEY